MGTIYHIIVIFKKVVDALYWNSLPAAPIISGNDISVKVKPPHRGGAAHAATLTDISPPDF